MSYCTFGRSGLRVSRLTLGAMTVVGLVLSTQPAWSQVSGQVSVKAVEKTPGTMKDDIKHRAREIHWPEGFNPEKADLFSHNELVIHASCEKIWHHIVDATKWPEWYPNSKGVRIAGDNSVLSNDTVFQWTTFGLPLESKLHEFVPYSRIGWYGYAPGTTPSAMHSFYHTWFLTPVGNACRVVTDEVGMGPDAAHLRETDESLMHRGHDLWLATLKWVSEGR